MTNVFSKKKMMPWNGIAFVMMLIVPTMAVGAGAQWADEELKIVRHPSTGVVKFLRSKQGIDSGADKTMLKNGPKKAASIFLKKYSSLLGMPDADNELSLDRKSDDDIGMTHLRLKQAFQGVPVYGAEVTVHYQQEGKKVSSVNGTFLPNLKVNIKPDIDSEDAVAIVREIQQDGELWGKPLLSIYIVFQFLDRLENRLDANA